MHPPDRNLEAATRSLIRMALVEEVVPLSTESMPKPGRCRPMVTWPLQLAAGALEKLQDVLTDTRSFVTYQLNLERWYEPREDDIFIVSYPKSGTTLMQMLLYQLTTD